MFQKIQRNPTNVECFDLAQSNRWGFSFSVHPVSHVKTEVICFLGGVFSNVSFTPSEHSRHWFFRGRMVVDGQEQKETLFSLIMDTQQHSNQNNVIKFCDNSR